MSTLPIGIIIRFSGVLARVWGPTGIVTALDATTVNGLPTYTVLTDSGVSAHFASTELVACVRCNEGTCERH